MFMVNLLSGNRNIEKCDVSTRFFDIENTNSLKKKMFCVYSKFIESVIQFSTYKEMKMKKQIADLTPMSLESILKFI